MINIYGKDRNELVFQLIEAKIHTKLRRDVAVLSNFTQLSGNPLGDVQVTVKSKDQSIYYNERNVQYNKIDLNKELDALRPTLEMTAQSSTHSLLPALETKYGIRLTTDDIILTLVDTTKTPWEIFFRAKPESLIVKTTGAGVRVTVTDATVQLPNIIKRITLTGLPYPSEDATRIQGPILTHPVISQRTDVLARYIVGYVINMPTEDDWVVADALSNETGESWSFKQTGFTLYGARVVYNGSVAGAAAQGYYVNDTATNVLVFQCGAAGDVGGYVSVHY